MFRPAEHHKRTRTQYACKCFERIAAQIDVDVGRHRTLAGDHSKTPLVENQEDRRALQWQRIGDNLRYQKRDSRAKTDRKSARFLQRGKCCLDGRKYDSNV